MDFNLSYIGLLPMVNDICGAKMHIILELLEAMWMVAIVIAFIISWTFLIIEVMM